MARILVLNGPNLNLLGSREPQVYGHKSLRDIEEGMRKRAGQAGHDVDFFQSNAEHGLIERIHTAGQDQTAFILINPGAFTHTSVALRDALLGVAVPFIELHISNIFAREVFRHHSYLSDVAVGVICGLGTQGYTLALDAAVAHLTNTDASPQPQE